jgi:hypothetical protein
MDSPIVWQKSNSVASAVLSMAWTPVSMVI